MKAMIYLVALLLASFSAAVQAQAYVLVGAAAANGNASANLGVGYELKRLRTERFAYAVEGSYFDIGEVSGLQLSGLVKYTVERSPRFSVFGSLNLHALQATDTVTRAESVTTTTVTPHKYKPTEVRTTTVTTIREVERKDNATDFGFSIGAMYRQSPELSWRGSVSFVPSTEASKSFKLFAIGLVQEF